MRKFQDVQFVKLPWVETIFDANGNLLIVRCKVYIKIERKQKLLIPKWDSFEKHARKRKNEEEVKVVDIKCAYAKNETKFVSMNCPSVLKQVQGGFERENKRKVIQFASIFMLLAQGKPMTNYKDLWPLYQMNF